MTVLHVNQTGNFQPPKTVFGNWQELYEVLDQHFTKEYDVNLPAQEFVSRAQSL